MFKATKNLRLLTNALVPGRGSTWGTGVRLVSTSALPLTTSALPLSTSALPLSTSALPLSTSALPLTTSALPLSTSVLPLTTSALPLSTSVLPLSTSAALPGSLLRGGGFKQSSTHSPVKGQQLRFYRAGTTSRSIEQQRPEPQKGSPQLMDFPWVVWPSLWHTIRNWIFANLLIHRYLDQEFDIASFKKGSIQALVHVSGELSKGNFEALDDLITKPSLEEIRRNYANFSLKQRLDLAVVKEDIFFSFPYQIGMIFTNEGGPHERIFVEITMCYHVFRGFQDYINSTTTGETPGGLRGVYDNHDRISIANYRFIREFTKGVVDEWTISLANHFKPGEMIQRQ